MMIQRGKIDHRLDPGVAKLHLLVLSSDTFPPTRVDVSVLFGEELAKRGHHIDWILQSASACDVPYITEWGGGRVWVGSTDLGSALPNRIRKHFRSVLHDLKVFTLARRHDYDVIQVKDKFIAGLFAIIASRLSNARFVYWLSWPFPEESLTLAREGRARYPTLYFLRGKLFKFMLYRLILPAAHHIFVQSEQMRRDVAVEGIAMDKMTAVPMGIKISSAPSENNKETSRRTHAARPSFLYLGSLIKLRRLDFLVRVLALVQAQIPDTMLYLVGAGDDPSDEQLIYAEATRLRLESDVVFTGQLPRVEALKYVREADVCVSPFFPTPVLRSTSPTKVVEYMAMGKPIVANDHPEQSLLIDQSGAGFCVPWDENAFADAIVRLLQDPKLAKAMGEKGPGYVARNREYHIIADGVERAYLRMLSPEPKTDVT